MKLIKNVIRSNNFHFFPFLWLVKRKAFELTYDCLIFFPCVFPVQNICRKFQFASRNVLKVLPEEN